MQSPSGTSVRVVAALLGVGALCMLAPLWAPLVLAAWFADLALPMVRLFERLLRGRHRGAAAVVVLLVLTVVVPIGAAGVVLFAEGRELLEQVRGVLEHQGPLAPALVGTPGSGPPQPRDWADLVSRYGADAWRAASTITRASTSAIVAVLVFVAALYTFAADGDRAYAWFEQRLPFPRDALARLAHAFRETGRGLLIAGGGTALVQGAVAAVAYLAIGIPRALLLGLLTALCAIVPVVGTALGLGAIDDRAPGERPVLARRCRRHGGCGAPQPGRQRRASGARAPRTTGPACVRRPRLHDRRRDGPRSERSTVGSLARPARDGGNRDQPLFGRARRAGSMTCKNRIDRHRAVSSREIAQSVRAFAVRSRVCSRTSARARAAHGVQGSSPGGAG